MSRKPKKGYYVRGQFVAEGSELDLELKRESTELQKLGEELLGLRADLMTRLDLPDKLLDALAEARRITNFEGKRRQMQFVGKLMRQLDPEVREAARAALIEQHMPSARETALLHTAEQWRDRLIASDEALAQWIADFPQTDSQQLRALVRQARKDAPPQDQAAVSQGLAPRHGRAYREVFQLVREQLSAVDTSDSEPDPREQR